MRVFEYGSGGSTLFWLRYGAVVVSIEHDPNWYDLVCQRLSSSPSIDYRLVPPEPADGNLPPGDPADPGSYATVGKRLVGCTFRNYVSQIDAFPDEHFDVILIDGRARPACIKHSVRKVNAGGMIILDNAEREYYLRQTDAYWEGFDRHQFFGFGPVGGGMWRTDVYVRYYAQVSEKNRHLEMAMG